MKGFSLLGSMVMSLIIVLVHNIDVSMATSWMMSETANITAATTPNHLKVQWEEEEYLSFDSHFGRMLYDVSQTTTGRTNNMAKPAVPNCPPVQRYRSCLPSPNGGPPRQRCGDYQRTC